MPKLSPTIVQLLNPLWGAFALIELAIAASKTKTGWPVPTMLDLGARPLPLELDDSGAQRR
jgi:hypothetical protein